VCFEYPLLLIETQRWDIFSTMQNIVLNIFDTMWQK
jgi:hypothetical protein